MATLTNTKVKDTYPTLLKVTSGLSSTLTLVEDGDATASALSLSSTTVGVKELEFTVAPSTTTTSNEALFIENGVAVSRTLGTSAYEDAFQLLAGTAISVGGSYPYVTVNNTKPDLIISLTGDTYNVISGTYPIFSVTSPLTGTFKQFNGDIGVHAASTPNETFTFTGGTGISTIVENANQRVVINNDAPDQVVSISGGQDINVTGTYPNFTVNHGLGTISAIATDSGIPAQVAIVASNMSMSFEGGTGIETIADDATKKITFVNTAPDEVVSIAGTGGATVTGTYPNFTVDTSSIIGIHEEMFVGIPETSYTLSSNSQQVVSFSLPDNTNPSASYHFGTAPAKLSQPTNEVILNSSGKSQVVYIDIAAHVDVLSPNSDITYILETNTGTGWALKQQALRTKGTTGLQVDSFWGIFILADGEQMRIVISSDSGNVVLSPKTQLKIQVKETGNII